MSQQITPKLFDNIEHHLESAGKSIVRGLLAACSGTVLMWMILLNVAPSRVSIPGLEFEIPTLLGGLALVLSSTVFGIAAAARVWKVARLEFRMFSWYHWAPSQERTEYFQSRIATSTRRSPIWGPFVLFGITLCGHLLHALYFYLFFEFGEWEQYQDAPLWLRGFLGQVWMSFGMALFTTAPFWFLYVVRFLLSNRSLDA